MNFALFRIRKKCKIFPTNDSRIFLVFLRYKRKNAGMHGENVIMYENCYKNTRPCGAILGSEIYR